MNKFDEKGKIDLDDLTVENFDELVNCKHSLDIDNLIRCDNCNGLMLKDDIVIEERDFTGSEDFWNGYEQEPDEREIHYTDNVKICPLCEYGDEVEYDEFSYTSFTNEDLFDGDITGLDDYVSKDFMAKLLHYRNSLNENKEINNMNNKLSLQEATIKALYDGLDDTDDVHDVEGIVDDVLVITDPEITTDEYNEVIERATEIVEDTPEGDIPLNDEYLGQYAQTCPICGGTFVEDHILEPRSYLSNMFRSTRSICYGW